MWNKGHIDFDAFIIVVIANFAFDGEFLGVVIMAVADKVSGFVDEKVVVGADDDVVGGVEGFNVSTKVVDGYILGVEFEFYFFILHFVSYNYLWNE